MDISKFLGEFTDFKKNFDKKYTRVLLYAGMSMILIGSVFIAVISFILLN
jgi:hypothetical protein